MMRAIVLAGLAAALALSGARADMTIRFHTESKSIAPPPDQSVRIQGNRASFRIFNLEAIADFDKQELTLVDPARKRFTTIPISEYAARLKAVQPKMPAAATQMFDPAKSKVATALTGRTETIQGIAAEEREVTVTAEAKVAMRFWCAKSDVRELAVLGRWQSLFLDAGDMFPGQKAILQGALPAGTVILRAHEELLVPPAGAPLLEIDQNVAEISTAPLAEPLFRVPAEYTAASFEDVYRGAVR